MKKFILLLALVLSPSAAFADGGGIGTRNVNSELRTRTIVIPAIHPTAAADVTAGTDGVVAVPSIVSVLAPVWTSSIAAMPYPAKVNIAAVDVSANNGTALTCTSVRLSGTDQYGGFISETVTSISETAKKSTLVYGKLTRIAFVNCAGGAADDIVKVSASLDIGLGMDITRVGAVLSVCISNASGNYTCLKPGSSDSATVFATTRVDVAHDSISLLSLTTNTVDDNDDVVIRVRAPAGLL